MDIRQAEAAAKTLADTIQHAIGKITAEFGRENRTATGEPIDKAVAPKRSGRDDKTSL